MPLDFTDQVAIVTGAGSGLGRAYALELARRGAKLVVNDMGESADAVAAEIRELGGDAIACAADVSDFAQMEAMAARALDTWGAAHILINNAGILRDRTFAKMDMADFEAVLRVNLMGSAYATKAVWEAMRRQNYGRVLMTTSSTGLGGNFGQANYAAAKAGVLGLGRALRLEGAKYDIRVNSIAPTAGTGMTADIFPEEAYAAFSPEAVVPAALFLVSKDAPSDALIGASGGLFQSAFIAMNDGVLLGGEECTPEAVAEAWPGISEVFGLRVFENGMQQSQRALERLAGKRV